MGQVSEREGERPGWGVKPPPGASTQPSQLWEEGQGKDSRPLVCITGWDRTPGMALRVATHAHRGGPGGAGQLAGMPILANLCPGPPFAPFSPEQALPRPRAPPGSSPPPHSRPVSTSCPEKGLGESSPHTFALTLLKARPLAPLAARVPQETFCPAAAI